MLPEMPEKCEGELKLSSVAMGEGKRPMTKPPLAQQELVFRGHSGQDMLIRRSVQSPHPFAILEAVRNSWTSNHEQLALMWKTARHR